MKTVNFDFALNINLEVGDIIIKDGLKYIIREITENLSYNSARDITYKADLYNYVAPIYVDPNGFVHQEECPSITFTSFDIAYSYEKSKKDTKEENIKEWVDLLYG